MEGTVQGKNEQRSRDAGLDAASATPGFPTENGRRLPTSQGIQHRPAPMDPELVLKGSEAVRGGSMGRLTK